MANIFENKDRRVIPNWRSFSTTVKLGELDNCYAPTNPSSLRLSIDDYTEDWVRNKTMFHAGDLISASLVNGITNQLVEEAAEFIISNSRLSSEPQIQLAKKVLNNSVENHNNDINSVHNHHDSEGIINVSDVRDKIRMYKRLIEQFPFNPILYVEISRYYSIIGQHKQAISSMKIALFLAPENRFILRSAVRLFAHCDELEYAHDILRKSTLTSSDPWLMSSEIALATLRDRSSRFMKKGADMISNDSFSPFNLTELASSLGTVELINGSHKNSRRLFRKALVAPNDNSLAQVEWASNKDVLIYYDPSSFNIKQNYEAIALKSFNDEDINKALDNTYKWLKDMPFTKRPVMFGSHIASVFLNDSEKAREFLIAGLISHPGDAQIINNLAYSYALENRPDDALECLKKISLQEEIAETTKICLIATRGLIYFRKGFYDLGRKNYIQSIEESNTPSNKHYNWLAILNYAREEILIKSEFVEPLIKIVEMIPDSVAEKEIAKLKGEIIQLYKSLKT